MRKANLVNGRGRMLNCQSPGDGRWLPVVLIAAALIWTPDGLAEPPRLPPFSVVESTVQRHFQGLPHLERRDLITRGDVEPLFAQLESAGWAVSDKKTLMEELLGDNESLVRTLRSREGLRFMRQVGSYKLIYDRLDRVTREPGGQRLLRDLIKLPDAARYAKQTPGPGLPGLTDFLPKQGSGKSRRVADYHKPTGKIYTQAQLLERLEEFYQEDLRRQSRAE